MRYDAEVQFRMLTNEGDCDIEENENVSNSDDRIDWVVKNGSGNRTDSEVTGIAVYGVLKKSGDTLVTENPKGHDVLGLSTGDMGKSGMIIEKRNRNNYDLSKEGMFKVGSIQVNNPRNKNNDWRKVDWGNRQDYLNTTVSYSFRPYRAKLKELIFLMHLGAFRIK